MHHRFLAAAAAFACAASAPAVASCGAAFCSLMTDRYAQGAGDAHAGWSADLRLEAVTQNRLRSGSHGIDGSEVPATEPLEQRTRNLNLLTSLSYGLDADWSFTLRVPLVQRDHRHLLEDGIPQAWRFTRLGDAQVLARRQFAAADAGTAWALFGGLKLPTGSIDVVNGAGVRAERALQPGSGTTDLVLGAAWRRAVGPGNALIGQASVAEALNTRDDFKPGRRIEASVGWSHAYSPTLGAVLQLNARHRERDRGAQAEPENSGSTTIDLSPGVTVGVGSGSTLYAYLQLPLYQRVNGIQLVPRQALAVGWTMDF